MTGFESTDFIFLVIVTKKIAYDLSLCNRKNSFFLWKKASRGNRDTYMHSKNGFSFNKKKVIRHIVRLTRCGLIGGLIETLNVI